MRRRFHTSNKEANMDEKQRSPARKPIHSLYYRRHHLQSVDRQGSTQKQGSTQREYSRFISAAAEDVLKSFRSNRRESPQRSLSRNSAGSSQDEQFYTRASLEGEKETENYSEPTEAEDQDTKSSSSAYKFLQELKALPTDVFLKIVLMKLDDMEVNGFSELSELAKFINMSQNVFDRSLPPEIERVLKQMAGETGTNLSNSPAPQRQADSIISEIYNQNKDIVIPVPEIASSGEYIRPTAVSAYLRASPTIPFYKHSSSRSHQRASSTIQCPQYASSTIPSQQHASSTIPSHQYDSSFVPSQQHASAIVPSQRHASAIVPSPQYASSSLPSYQNPESYPGVSYEQVDFSHTPSSNEEFAYNAASSDLIPAEPALTSQEQRDSYSAYNAHQSQYSQHSLPDFNNFRY